MPDDIATKRRNIRYGLQQYRRYLETDRREGYYIEPHALLEMAEWLANELDGARG